MDNRGNIVKNILALLVVLTILLPSGLSLAHSLENHEHYVQCDNPSDVHVHEKNQECKFNLINYKQDGVFAIANTTSFTPLPTFSYCFTYNDNLEISVLEKENTRGPPVC